MKHLPIILLLTLACARAMAADAYVGTTADLTNAIANAVSNDTVWVSNGTYTCTSPMGWSGSFLNIGAGVTVRSLLGLPADVVLDGNATGRVATLAASSWLMGCTVTNGNGDIEAANYTGAGVEGGSVSNCIITGNLMTTGGEIGSYGGGVANCTVWSSIIRGNYACGGPAGAAGGGAYNCKVWNSLIENNTAYTLCGIPAFGGGGGYGCNFVNCTIVSNLADGGTGGGVLECFVTNTISWDNNSADDFTGGSNYYSCGVGYTGPGSITNDPLFVSSSDFSLQTGSPCRDVGVNQAWMIGAKDLVGSQRIWPKDGTVDMGAYEYGSAAEYLVPRVRGASLTSIRASSLTHVSGVAE